MSHIEGEFPEFLNQNLRETETSKSFAAFLPELFSFKGLGPELNNLIAASNHEISNELNQEQKLLLAEQRNKVLADLFKAGLGEIYGEEVGQELAFRILDKIEQVKLEERVPQQNKKKEVCYIVYPDTFGGPKELIRMLPYLSELGVTKLHLLPFFDHAGDGGYAVRYHNLDEPLQLMDGWSFEDFQELVAEAEKLEINLLVDVILNHMAIDSPILEDREMSEKLLLSWSKGELPFSFVRTEEDVESGGTYAIYKLADGPEVRILVMFPEQTGEDPLLVVHQGRDVYHTFYPFQPDLDFRNSESFELISNIILQVSTLIGKKGQLRLDAIPFIGKKIDRKMFKNMDNDDGYKIITLIKILLALYSPDINLVAEASRPKSEISKYLRRVGGAYDFISLPYFLLAVANEDPSLFLNKLSEMVEDLGVEEIENLVFALQTHDDYPLAELNDPIANQVWQAVKDKSESFGQKDGGKSSPKGAVTRLTELCNHDPDKLAATVALAAFTPHGDLFFLFGTENGLVNDYRALELEKIEAEKEDRKVDRRALIRSKLDIDEYQKSLSSSVFFSKMSEVLSLRNKYLPEKIIDWQQEVIDGLVEIDMTGESNGEPVYVKVFINYSAEEKVTNDGQIIEAWGYRVVSV